MMFYLSISLFTGIVFGIEGEVQRQVGPFFVLRFGLGD